MKTAISHRIRYRFHAHLINWIPRALFITLVINIMPDKAVFAASTAPLIQQSNITYLGAFALPSWANGATYGTSYFEYGGHAVTPYRDPATGKRTLFMEGHAQNSGQVAQVEIPATLVKSSNWSALPVAKVLQNFADVTDGRLSSLDPAQQGNPTFVYGLLPYNGRLIVGASNSYSATQTVSHGVSGLTLAATNDFKGWYSWASNVSATPRALGGPMTLIPAEWQAAFGGPAFTGQCCISITGSTSAGPSLTVFNPDDVGKSNPIPGKTVLFYPLSNPVCGAEHCEAQQSSIYNLAMQYGGVAFPPGSRSVLFVTAQGTGCYWYGGWNENSLGPCPSPDTNLQEVKGPHAPPYRYQILAYDANDLLAVKNGTQQPWQPKPYAVIILDGMPYSTNNNIKGAGFDPETGRLYITQDYGTQPRVEVYQITVPGTSSPAPLSSPTNLRITG